MFFKIVALKNFAILTGKHLYWNNFVAYWKSEIQDLKVRPATQDPRARPYGGTLWWDPKAEP